MLLIPILCQGQDLIVEGYVLDVESNPLINATVQTNSGPYAVTDTSGYYRLSIPFEDLSGTVAIKARYIGKQTHTDQVAVPPDTTRIRYNIVLKNLDLYMDDVTVTAEPTTESVSNSTYVIDRMAIEQSQSYTLGNLLQLIPGKSITNPQLQGAETISFRSIAPGSYKSNNSFGIGIYMNGQNINNNANMQSLNPLSNATGLGTFGASRSQTDQYRSGDTPGGGFDLREIPVGNIEQIEVVQGVASAEYGDITEGGIFIETSAGRSPWNLSIRRSGGEIGVGINKGFQLHPRHAMNVSLDYLYSNANPRDRVKSFNRVSSSLLWTSYYGTDRDIKNTLSLSYSANLDDFKTDPDLGPIERTYYQNKRFSFSNRLRIQTNNWLYDNLNYSISANWGKSTSVLDTYINPGVSPVIASEEEGVHEGTYHPANYRSQRKVLGEPISLGAQLTFNRAVEVSDWEFNLSYGGNVSFDANYGKGRVFNPLRPVPQNRAVSRPVSYKELRPEVWQGGAFIENTINGEIAGHQMISSLGVRADIQHGYKTLSPRINSRFYITENLSLTGAYGIQTKTPGLIHLYPGPDYEDYTLLNSYTGKLKESIFLAYTRVSRDVSADPEPMRSYRSELGFEWDQNNFSLNTTFYRNISKNGLTVEQRPEYLDLPVYEIVEQNPGQEPVIRNTGETNRTIYQQGYITNALYSRNWGVEVTARRSKIESIQTSFSLNLSYTSSFYFNQTQNISMRGVDPQPQEEIWFGIYPADKQKSGRAQALLTSTHHISKLGLLLTIRSEAFLYNYNKVLSNSNRAEAYVNNDLELIPISEDEVNDPRFDKLDRASVDGRFTRNPSFVYFNFHMNVSKNIGESVRLSFFANNFLNIRPEAFNSEGERTRILNQPPYFGMELRLTL